MFSKLTQTPYSLDHVHVDSMTALSVMLVIWTMKAAASTDQKMNRTARAFGTAAIRNPSRTLPIELKRIIADFVHFDWLDLLDAFLETPESHNFRNFVRECDRTGALALWDRSEWRFDPIGVDSDGNIIEINLCDHQLTDSAIGDLSKLPSTLKELNLWGNNLTTLDVAALPRGLEVLYLSDNQLIDLDFTKLPTALLSLSVSGNALSAVNLTQLPRHLENLWLQHNGLEYVDLSALTPSLKFIALELNHLTSVDLSQVPAGMDFIHLGMNYLEERHLNSIPNDSRETMVTGHRYQRPREFWL